MSRKTSILCFILVALIYQETKACMDQSQDQFISCFEQFNATEKGPNFWEEICSNSGLYTLDCILQTTSQCPQLWNETVLGDLYVQRALIMSISPANDNYAVECERHNVSECETAYSCFTSIFGQTDSARYMGLSEFYRWFCGEQTMPNGRIQPHTTGPTEVVFCVKPPTLAGTNVYNYKSSSSHDHGGRYEHIWNRALKSSSPERAQADDLETWSEYGVTYINECFRPAEELCQATLDYLRNFQIIKYSNGNALTFSQVSQQAAVECAEMGVLVTECQDTGACVVTIDQSQAAINTCLNNNASQCFTDPVIDFDQNNPILQCDYSDFTSQCIQDGCGPQAAGFFIRLFEYLNCGVQANSGCPAVSIILEVGQAGYEMMTTVNFPATLPGNTAVQQCPTDYEGNLTRRCSSNGSWEPVKSLCIKDILKDIREQLDNLLKAPVIDQNQFQGVLDELNEVTNPNRESINKPPLDEVKHTLNDITDIFERKPNTTTKELESFMEIVSNALDDTNEDEWVNKVEAGASSIMRDVERLIDKTLSSQECSSRTAEQKNLAVTIGSSSSDIRYSSANGSGEIFVSKQALLKQGLTSSVCYGGVHYKTLAPILSRNVLVSGEAKELEPDVVVNSDVVALQLVQIIDKMDPPSILTFRLHQKGLLDPVCVSWDFTAPGTAGNGAWTPEGCEFFGFSDNGEVICHCSHLTNFAVLMSIAGTNADHVKALSIISAVGCAISIFALLLTIIFHILVWRLVRSDRSIILMNLCVALLIALVAFLAGINRTESPEACKVIAAILHFLFLAVFVLMLTQGIEIMICVVHVFVTKFRLKLLLPFAWLLPAIIVAVSLGVTKAEGYGNKEYCWLSVESGLIWAFIAPAAVVIIVNIIVIIVVFKKLFSSRSMKDKSAKERTKTSLRSICVLLPLLGCTWAFGILSINSDTVAFQYIFCILNSLQGLFIFIFHCVLNNQLKDALRRRKAKKRSLATLESDLKKRSRSDSMGQDLSASSPDKNSESSSKKKTKLLRYGLKASRHDDMNGLDEWQRDQRKEYQRELRRQISDKLDWTE